MRVMVTIAVKPEGGEWKERTLTIRGDAPDVRTQWLEAFPGQLERALTGQEDEPDAEPDE